MESPASEPIRERPGRLIGARCVACGATAYPEGAGCVRCGGAELAAVELADRGVIASRTKVGDRWICEIRLEGGPLILGWIDGRENTTIGKVARLALGSETSRSLRFTQDD